MKIQYLGAFLRSPLRVAFVALLTLLVLPVSSVQATQDSAVNGLSCQAFADVTPSAPSFSVPSGTKFGARCFFEFAPGATTSMIASWASGIEAPSFFLRGSSSWSATIGTHMTSVTKRHGDIYTSTGVLAVAATHSELPDNFLEMTGNISFSQTGRTAVSFAGPFSGGSIGWTTAGLSATGVFNNGVDGASIYPNFTGPAINLKVAATPGSSFDDAFGDLYPEDLGRGGFAGPGGCPAVKIGVEVEGQALTVADYDDVLYPRNGSPGRDEFVFLATFTGRNIVADPSAITLRYRWPGSDGNWSPVFDILDTVAFNGGADSAMSFRIGTNVDRYLSQLQWECHDPELGAYNVGPAKFYLPWWEPGTSINDPNWTSSANFQSPCRAIFVSPTSGTVAPGESGRIRYSLATSDGLDIKVFAYGVANFLPQTSPSTYMSSSSLFGATTGGPAPYVNYVAPGEGWLNFTLPASVDSPIQYADLVLSCTDGSVSGLILPGSPDLGLTGSLDPARDPTCWEQGGMSLTSPASWITGIAKMLGCLSTELFVPAGDSLSAAMDDFNANVEDKPPFIAVYVAIDFVSDLDAAFDASSGSGCFEVGQIPGVTADDEVCASGTVQTTNDQRQMLAIFFVGPMVLGMAAHMLSLLRSGETEVFYLANERNPGGINI